MAAANMHDSATSALVEAMNQYEAEHPGAEAEVRRQNPAVIRLRVIDPEFSNMNKSQRHKRVWAYIDSLSEDLLTQVTMVLCLTQDELKDSFANFEFEHPIPSRL